ncbi:MAG: hypothetical protein M1816_007891 [Peltula sp. TS41687]|nr:MAG: hypothetical protein M1816_007891 [Peltula sp. TS41687]
MSASARDKCTLDTCPIEWSVYNYRPSLAANSVLLALFAISLIVHIIQGVRWRTWGFTITLILGCSTEVIGYIGRIISWKDPFGQNGFLTQICCLTIAPAFFAASIYLCISKIVTGLGRDISRISPRTYMLIFIPCDLLSLILQSTGGGLSSVASQNDQSTETGSNIMLAGLAFQVVTMSLFMILCADYAFRYFRARRRDVGLENTPATTTRLDWKFKLFLYALALATITIFIRCVYRVVELADGWNGDLIHNETLFIVLEGVMVIIASFALNVGHPGMAFGKAGTTTDEKAIP